MTKVAVGNQIWNYTEVGKGKKTPLLILHGWGRSGNEWITMANELSAWSGRTVYILDLPGFGGSSLPDVITIHQYSQLVKDFCAYMEIETAMIIGHSLGGRVGIVLSATYPKFVERLILIDPAGVKPKSLKRIILKSLATLFGWVPLSLRRRLAGRWMDEDYRNSPALQNLYRAVVGQDLRTLLLKVKCKTIVLWGQHDPILPLSLTKIYRQLLPDTQIRVVWGSGHDPHLTKYEQTLAILQESVE
jgi:pimeloyl-ACP methyl ester carboxylesterase